MCPCRFFSELSILRTRSLRRRQRECEFTQPLQKLLGDVAESTGLSSGAGPGVSFEPRHRPPTSDKAPLTLMGQDQNESPPR